MDSKQERNKTLDIAKGISILLMTISHLYLFNKYDYVIKANEILVLFKMPLFILISGFLFSDKQDIKTFILRKADGLLKPIFSIMLLTIVPIIGGLGYLKYGSVEAILKRTLDILSFIYGPLWFPIILFITLVLLKYVVRLSNYKSKKYLLITFISLIFILYIIHLIGLQLHIIKLYALVYFLIIATTGYLVKIRGLMPTIMNAPSFISATLIFTCSIYFQERLNIQLNFNENIFGSFIPTTIVFSTGIIMVLNIARFLSKIPLLSSILETCSLHSFFILAFHIIIGNYILYQGLSYIIAPNLLTDILCFVLTIYLCCITQDIIAKIDLLKWILLPNKVVNTRNSDK